MKQSQLHEQEAKNNKKSTTPKSTRAKIAMS
jgi:hypothetical protein